MQKHVSIYVVLLSMLVLAEVAVGQISGRVFDNGNGKTTYNGRPVTGLSVKAYEISEAGQYALLTQTQSDANGHYSLNIPEGKQVKLLFEEPLPQSNSPLYPDLL